MGCVFTLVWNLGDKANEHGGEKERGRKIKKQTLNYRKHTDGCQRRGREEGTCSDEHQLLC